jgi:hypothetical protein
MLARGFKHVLRDRARGEDHPADGHLAGLAEVVVDRLRNEIADPSVRIGTILLDERKLIGGEIDRRAHQALAGLRPRLACEQRTLSDIPYVRCGIRRRDFFFPVRMRCDW